MQPVYPLPKEAGQLQALAEKLDGFSREKPCLGDAHFHAWRGAVLMALGRTDDAVEPLERALMVDPDLPGAQMDLAQALAAQGDAASASALLRGVLARGDVDAALRSAIDVQLAGLQGRRPDNSPSNGEWLSRTRIAVMGGADSNLNNAPASTEITLTLPGGNQTFTLDPSSRPRQGGALLATAQWQGLRARGDSLWIVQGELRTRRTTDRATRYEQADVAAAWLQAPAAPQQWVARLSGTHLRFGGADLLDAVRASVQRQFGPLGGGSQVADITAGCRPTLAAELEHRRYPSTPSLDGLYSGAAAGLICRPALGSPAASAPDAFLNVEARLGEDHPADSTRAGGVYRRGEIRVQWEQPVFAKGRGGLQWLSTRQTDSQPYSTLLGNVPRTTLRHALQLEASWPIAGKWSLVTTAEGTWQKSNITAFVSRQRSFYLGLRWDSL